jgi:hypothetical protein
MLASRRISQALCFFLMTLASGRLAAAAALIPQIDGDWWSVAGNPDLGEWTAERQQPVDFAIWQAADGTWQIWSCIRNTKCGGRTRLFYRWEGRSLTDTDWRPMGIAMTADPLIGETEGGLQAPQVFKVGDMFHMVYGDWIRICLATSRHGKRFERTRNERGQPDLFRGPYENSRDPMVLKIGNLYYCYYMGHKQGAEYQSAIFGRTSHDLRHWSEPILVSAGGVAATQSDWYGGDAECPFVLEKDGLFYLFRNQVYGTNHLNTQYASPNPLVFGVGDDRYRIGTLPVAAPEIIWHEGKYYIAALKPALDGIRVARLAWASQVQAKSKSSDLRLHFGRPLFFSGFRTPNLPSFRLRP